MIEMLWARFEKLDDSVKGDVLHLFGQSGNKIVTDKLKIILSKPYPKDVLEAAEEALASALSRTPG